MACCDAGKKYDLQPCALLPFISILSCHLWQKQELYLANQHGKTYSMNGWPRDDV